MVTLQKTLREICNIFNKHFISVFNKDLSTTDFSFGSKCNTNLFSRTYLKNIFANMRNKNYRGPDNIPIHFYIKTFDCLGDIYTKLFNTLYRDCYIPDCWRIAAVTPLCKSKLCPTSVTNYRPISISNSLFRIYETALKCKLEQFPINFRVTNMVS